MPTYRTNKWKEPFLKHGDKNAVTGQCSNCERPYSLYSFPVENDKKAKREMRGFRFSNEKIQIKQSGPQKAVIGFVNYIL